MNYFVRTFMCMGCGAGFLSRDSVEETKAAMLASGWGWYDGEGTKLLYCIDCRHIPKPRMVKAPVLEGQDELF